MKLSPEAEKALEDVKQSLRVIGHMSKAGIEHDAYTSLGTMNEAANGLLHLARFKKALEAMS